MTAGTLTESLTETLALFGGSGEPRTTTELAEELDLGRRSTYDRLERLVDQDRLRTKKVGANARVWWRPSDSTQESPDRKESEHGRRTDREEFESLVEAVDEYAIFTMDPEGHIRTWNPGARRIKGYDAADIVGEHFSTFYTEEDRASDVPGRNLARATENGSTEDEGWRVRADGSRFWANVTITAIRDDDGELQGYAKVTRDMTERRESERQLRRERDFTQQVLETTPASIFVVEPSGEVVVANQQFASQLGADGDVEIGVDDLALSDESGESIPEDERPYRLAFERGESITGRECELELPDGTSRWLSMNVAPIAADGTVDRVVVVAQDVTQMHRQEQQLVRQRDELKAELDDVYARIDDAVFALDADWEFVYANEQAGAVLDCPAESLLGQTIWEAFPESTHTAFESEYRRAMETQETVSFVDYYDPFDAWFEVTAYPSEDGLSVYFRDVTDREETEQALRRSEVRQRLALRAADMAAWELDLETGVAPARSPEHDRIFGYGEPLEEWTIEQFLDHVHPDDREYVERRVETSRETAEWEFECRIHRADGERRWIAVQGTVDEEGGEPNRAVGTIQDVTDRKQRERELQRYETVVETLWDGVYALDPEENFVMANDAFLELTGYDRAELMGMPGDVVTGDDVNERANRQAQAVLDGERDGASLEFDLVTGDGETVPVESRSGPYQYDDRRYGRCGVVRDVAARKEYERHLEESKAQLEAATEAGAVGTFEWQVQEDELRAGPALAETFGIDEEAVWDGRPLEHFLERIHPADLEEVETAVEHALDSCGPYEQEYRVQDANGEYRWVVARGDVECEDGQPVRFPGALTDITERKRAEIELERQRERLEALNNLNEVVREITDAVIDQSTRAEIERTVCEHLAASESYRFAWIGDVDSNTDVVNLRAEAGVDGYLDDVTITVGSDDERSEGPTGRALRTGEMQVTQDVKTDQRHDPWREHVEEYDFRSSTAIPIVHEDTLYGVLNVYAERSHAFSEEERAVISQLGEIVGHAIAAAERKQALMSDELVELDFAMENTLEATGISMGPDERITLVHTVALDDGEFILYGTATADAIDTLEALVEAFDHWESVTIQSEGDPVNFDVRLSDPPVLSVVASLGGYVDEAVLEGGGIELRIHLAPTVEVRQVIDAVDDAYPGAEMRRRRQITRSIDDHTRRHREIVADLTDRQRSSLEAAYHAGFFEWPRDASGEDVAERLGVASPTFHQHLRKAERKVFDVLLTTEESSA